MITIKKRQHYVWRNYLRAWADKKDHIWALKKDEGKILRPELMGVAQEKYFYRVHELTEPEIDFMRRFINEKTPKIVRDFCFDLLNSYIIPVKLKSIIASKGIVGKDIDEIVRSTEINMFEDIHCIFEGFGEKILQCKSIEDLQSMEDEDWDAALTFMMFQYMRTKNMRTSIVAGFNEDSVQWGTLADKVWPLMSAIQAITMGRNLSIGTTIKFKLLDNKTTCLFLTTDQPIINYVGDISDDEGYAKALELYYPLSPRIALYIHFKAEQSEKIIVEDISEEQVEQYNRKMIDNSHMWVFSDTQKQLESYLAI